MVVMLCINQIYDGGAERVMAYLANYLADRGYTTVLVTSFSHINEYELSDRVLRVSLDSEVPYRNKVHRFIYRIKCLRKLCKYYNPDVTISFMLAPIVRTLVATAGLNTKNIISIRSEPELEFRGVLGSLILRFIVPHADGYVFQTEFARRFFSDDIRNRSAVIYNPIGEAFYKVSRERVPGRIVTCGRLSAEKNHGMLIEAFYEIHRHHPDTRLFIYGEGEERDNLQSIIESLNISEVVMMPGQVNDVPRVLGKADFFVLSSDTEGMPNALMEAMAAGIPCVSTDCPAGGPRTLIQQLYNGILIPVGDREALIKTLEMLISDSELASKIGKRAKASAERFSRLPVMQQWEDFIYNVCRRKSEDVIEQI